MVEMLVRFEPAAGSEAIERVEAFLAPFELVVNRVPTDDGTYLAASGDRRPIPWAELERLDGVCEVVREPPQYFFAGKRFKQERTPIEVGDVTIGGEAGEVVVIAGPCAIENRSDALETAWACKEAGADVFRAGAFKPRTSPYNFQGIGYRGLEILAEIRETVGLPVVTEAMEPADVPLVAECCDMLQVGTRNMMNAPLLKRLGTAGKPVLLKRGYAAQVEDLLKAAEFVIVYGNPQVVLCERGIQTFETFTRYTLDLVAVAALRELSHLPIVSDPSHGTGRPSLIPPLARASVAAGADALMIECHVDPERMIRPGDWFQALRPHELEAVVADVRALGRARVHA
jgi:3-deoxy-7-phosphoheptulonate synthase